MNFAKQIIKNLSSSTNNKIIIWPDNSFSTSTILISKINAYTPLLPTKNESILIAESLNEDTIALIISCIANGNPILFYPKHISFFKLIEFLKERKMKYFYSSNLLLKIILKTYNLTPLRLKLINDNSDASDILIKEVEDQHIAFYSFSSGSSGEVKCIGRSHQLLINQVSAINKCFGKYDAYTDLSIFPNVILYNLYKNRLSVIPDIPNFNLKKLAVEKIIYQIESHNVESMTGNKYFFNEIYKSISGRKIKNIKAIGIGGSPIDNHLLENLINIFPNAEINVIYGSTEAEPICIKNIKPTEIKPASMGYCVGEVHEDIQINFIDTANVKWLDQELYIGEICIKGNHVKSSDAVFLATGDWGYLHKNELYLTARKGNIEFYNGYQHLCIEHVLNLNFKSEFAVIIKKDILLVYTESKISSQDIEMVLFINFNYKFNIKTIYKKIIKDSRQLSKILYHKLDEVRI